MRNQQEIHEAINAADDALIALRQAEKSLSGAGGWGLWDMLGGGFFTAFMKHDRIGRAEDALREARNALGRLRSEMADLGQIADIDLDMGDFLRFTDFFMDNILSDWMVQSKIQQGRRQVQQAIQQVEYLRSQLWGML